MTLDEFYNKYGATKHFKECIENDVKVLCKNRMTQKEMDVLTKVILVAGKELARDCGLEE